MQTYISILRGINVSGKNIIKMDDLKKLFQNLQFHNIQTYIQSGNIVFSTTQTPTNQLQATLHQQIKTTFNLDIPVIVLTSQNLKQIVHNNPFAQTHNNLFLHVTFLSQTPTTYDPKSITDKKTDQEEIQIIHNAAYLYCPNGYGNTKLTNSFLENKLNVQATTRNWKTTLQLLQMTQ